MTAHRLQIDALIEEAERPAFMAACEQLRDCLGPALGAPPDIGLTLHKEFAGLAGGGTSRVIVLSLLREAATAVPLAKIEAAWRGALERLMQTSSPVFLCTIFRHVPHMRGPGGDASRALLERIRRLNLLACELSHDTGANVIDIDRTLAHFGGRVLRTDFRLTGQPGAEAAGFTIARGLIEGGLDDWASAEALEQAKKLHGGIDTLMPILRRRLKPGSESAGGNGPAAVVTLNASDPGL